MINRDLLETGTTDEQNASKERQKKTDRQTDRETDKGREERQPLRHSSHAALRSM